MQIIINGEAQHLDDGMNVSALLAKLKLNEKRVAVEVNREIVPPERYPEHRLSDSDRVEIVHFVGGG